MLSGDGSTGNVGRPLQFAWSLKRSAFLTRLNDAEWAALDEYLGNQTRATLMIPTALLPPGQTYRVQVQVQHMD